MTSAHRDEYEMPTVDELIAAGGIGASQVEQFRAAADVRFDGVRYGEQRPKPIASHLDWRFNQDSLERALVAHAFAAAGIVDAQLFRREKPDFWCELSGRDRFGLEVAEIHDAEHAAFENNVAMITLGVIGALDRDDRRELASGVHCAIALGLAPTSSDSRRIRDELISWFDESLPSTANGSVAFDARLYPVLVRHRPSASLRRGAGQSFVVKTPARSFSPTEAVSTALGIIERKRKKQYPIPTPWLVLGLTDQWGSYRASLSTLWDMRESIEIAPFSKVIIEYQGDVVVLGGDAFSRIAPLRFGGSYDIHA